MIPVVLTVIGLVSNMVGVAFAFFLGYRQPSHEEGVSIALEDGKRVDGARGAIEPSERTIRLVCDRLDAAGNANGNLSQTFRQKCMTVQPTF